MIVNICSFNTQGLCHSLHQIQHLIATHNIHITFIQETHDFKPHIITQFACKYNYEIITNSDNTPHRQGTAIILNKSLLSQIQYKSHNAEIILKKRIQSLSIQFGSSKYYFINTYLSSGNKQTNTRKIELETLVKHLENITQANTYILGDFNFVMNKIDRTGRHSPTTLDKLFFKNVLI